jgi:hypothetical protein
MTAGRRVRERGGIQGRIALEIKNFDSGETPQRQNAFIPVEPIRARGARLCNANRAGLSAQTLCELDRPLRAQQRNLSATGRVPPRG